MFLLSLFLDKLVVDCMKMGQRKATSCEEGKHMEEEREAENQARQYCERRQAAALAKLKADKEEQEKKKLAALPQQSNNNKDSAVHEFRDNEDMSLEKSTFSKETDKKKSSSELEEPSKVGAVLPASLDRGVHECSLFSARMKMKLPLQ